MDQFTAMDVARMARSLTKELESAGLTDIKVLTAGDEVLRLYKEAGRGRDIPQLAFREDAAETCSQFRGATWIFGQDEWGVGIMIAFNRIDLGNGTLADHLENNGALYLVDDIPVADPNPRVFASPARRLSGTACYLGEAWFREDRPGIPGYRGRGLARQVIRLGMAMAYLNFRPSFMFGLAPDYVAEKGIALQYGHYQVYPLGAVWPRLDGELDEVYLCITDEGDYIDLFREPVRRRELVEDFGRYKQEPFALVG